MRIHQARTPPGVLKRRAPGRGGARTPQVRAPKVSLRDKGYLEEDTLSKSVLSTVAPPCAALFFMQRQGCLIVVVHNASHSDTRTKHPHQRT